MCYFEQCAATQECHAIDAGHDTPPCHRIQTTVVGLSVDVKRHTGIHDFQNVLGHNRPGYLSLPSTHHEAVMVVVREQLDRKCTVPAES